MKKLLALGFFLPLMAQLLAQSTAPRYVLVEHFTNSRCSVCASRNPAMYNTLSQYADQVHHISFHPSVPYSNCVFYLENTTENNGRTAYYGVDGTPRVVLNGTLVPLAGQLLPSATLQAQLGQTSPVAVTVTENNGSATVKVVSLGAPPSGSYNLCVAVAERQINQTTPNGESLHRDVFRKMLTNVTGTALTLPAQGQSLSFNYNIPTDSDWNSNQIYLVAWVQNTDTKEVLNSGTKFDPALPVSSVNDVVINTLSLSPNPAHDATFATLPTGETPTSVEVVGLDGRLAAAQWSPTADSQIQISTSALPAGLFWVRLTTERGVYVGKLVKN